MRPFTQFELRAITIFIRRRGVTRCPTVYMLASEHGDPLPEPAPPIPEYSYKHRRVYRVRRTRD